ncbi:MAG: HAD-IA family hydrolase [Acutalibacteraceae bacterium]|nr:HAD-IA family hydrolase [Acutalibacteraceae bacterium]
MAKYRAVLFDFDGTLADTSPGIKNSIRYALGEKGIPVGDEKRLNYFIGPPLYEGFSHVYGTDKELTDELVRLYRVYYSDRGVYECALFPGSLEMLKQLRGAGLRLAVVSSKPAHFLKIVLPHLGIEDCFETVVGPELKNKSADKSFLIRKALEELGESASPQVVMVGDRHYDIAGARDAGVTAAGVTYGFGTKEELQAAGADFLADSAESLTARLLSNP